MTYTQESWIEHLEEMADFQRRYLVECIEQNHPSSEIVEYCTKLANTLNELEMSKYIAEKMKGIGNA